MTAFAALAVGLSSQSGTSLQPSSPSAPSPPPAKPIPIHKSPLMPLLGRGGPYAAGRPGNEVLLSSVRLMAALGGKRLKEPANRARRADWEPWVVAGPVWPIATRERHRRKRVVEQKNIRMTTRGVRILLVRATAKTGRYVVEGRGRNGSFVSSLRKEGLPKKYVGRLGPGCVEGRNSFGTDGPRLITRSFAAIHLEEFRHAQMPIDKQENYHGAVYDGRLNGKAA